jgi:type VI secretion system protein ImpG
VAGALDLSGQASADPHVERLIEAFAFLTARVQRNLDRQLPRLASALLDALYPQLTAPVPSMAVAEFAVDPKQARKAHGFTLPRGTHLVADTDAGASVRLATGWDLTLWPIAIEAVDRPDAALLPFLEGRGDVGCALRIRLAALGGESFAGMAPPRLRLRVAASPAVAPALCETLLERTRAIWAVDAAPGGQPVPQADRATGAARLLPGARVRAVGFAADEALLPDAPGAHRGRRLAQEYFAFPDKFLFLDIEGLETAAGVASGGWLDLVLLMDAAPEELAAAEGGALRLGAVPVVNLFPRVSEPIRLDGARIEHPVTPDARLERSTEIHSVRRVTLTRMERGEDGRVAPFFGFGEGGVEGMGWIARRTPARRADMGGTDLLIAFRDRAFEPARPDAAVAFAHLLCTNRGLAERLPVGARLTLERDAPVSAVTCATRPTPQLDPPAAGADLWRLVAHLTANQLSFAEGPQALASLKAHLTLYCGGSARADLRQIDGIVGIETRRVARRIGQDAWRGFCRGVEVTVTLDEEHFAGGSGYLFGSVLAQLLGLCAAPTAFTELALRSARREGEWARWPPMAGDAVLI